MRVRTLLVILGLILFPASRASASPFQNGSFEAASIAPGGFVTLGVGSTAITGWEVISASIDYIGSHWVAAAGTRSVDLNGNAGGGGIRQTFDTIIGSLYRVEFAMSGNPDGPPPVKAVTVNAAASTQTYTFDTVAAGATRPNMAWVYNTFHFTAIGTSTTLTFQSGTPGFFYGPAIDDVSVRVPEPMTLALLSVGMIGAVARRRISR